MVGEFDLSAFAVELESAVGAASDSGVEVGDDDDDEASAYGDDE